LTVHSRLPIPAPRSARITGSAVVTSVFHASFNLVATVYALAAIDPTLTIVMALVTAAVLVADRAALRNADANVSR